MTWGAGIAAESDLDDLQSQIDDQAISDHIEKVAHEAGYGSMAEFYGALRDRGELSDDFFLDLTPKKVEQDWNDYFAPILDSLADDAVDQGYGLGRDYDDEDEDADEDW